MPRQQVNKNAIEIATIICQRNGLNAEAEIANAYAFLVNNSVNKKHVKTAEEKQAAKQAGIEKRKATIAVNKAAAIPLPEHDEDEDYEESEATEEEEKPKKKSSNKRSSNKRSSIKKTDEEKAESKKAAIEKRKATLAAKTDEEKAEAAEKRKATMAAKKAAKKATITIEVIEDEEKPVKKSSKA